MQPVGLLKRHWAPRSLCPAGKFHFADVSSFSKLGDKFVQTKFQSTASLAATRGKLPCLLSVFCVTTLPMAVCRSIFGSNTPILQEKKKQYHSFSKRGFTRKLLFSLDLIAESSLFWTMREFSSIYSVGWSYFATFSERNTCM